MLDDLIKERQKKLEAIREAGIDPYPSRVARSFEISRALADFDELEKSGRVISLAGRVMALRDQGKIVFADIADESDKIQLVLKEDETKEFKLWQSSLDIGDFISATGPLFKTKKDTGSLLTRTVLYRSFATKGAVWKMSRSSLRTSRSNRSKSSPSNWARRSSLQMAQK